MLKKVDEQILINYDLSKNETSFGIILADVTGLFIQSCLYMFNNIPGAEVSCPIK